jgi:hypothetical protein
MTMKKVYLFLLFTPFACCDRVYAQRAVPSDNWMDYIHDMAFDSEDGDERLEELFSELSFLADHPLDLSVLTADDLRRLPFLSDGHIRGIISYIERFSPLLTAYELGGVEGLDFRTVELLMPFVYAGDKADGKRAPAAGSPVHRGRHEVQLRFDQCLEEKEGYRVKPDSILAIYPNRRYLGEPFYTSLRYTYSFSEHIRAGLTAEKDAGEPMFNAHHKGYDFYSFHFLLKNISRLKTLAAGDYKMSFGQGLAAGSGFTPGRSNTTAVRAEQEMYGLRAHLSTGESDFLRGLAATVRWKDTEISAFYSHKNLDATMTDSLTASSIKTDGLHRLPRERSKAGMLPMTVFGGNICYPAKNMRLGLTALYYSFGDHSLEPAVRPYNIFYFRGSDNANVSVDYMVSGPYLRFYGETALSANRAPATLNALLLTPAPGISLLMSHRYYSEKYQAYLGNAFSQNTAVQNEQGVYVGVSISPRERYSLSAYADVFRFPWLRYGVSAPSAGRDYMVRVDFKHSEAATFYLRYKYGRREEDMPGAESPVAPYARHRARLQAQYTPSPSYTLKSSIEGVIYEKKKGLMATQNIGCRPSAIPLKVDLTAAYFHTADYDTRLGVYEKNLPYAYGTGQLYGHGTRLSAVIGYDISKKVSLFVKLANTHHYDRDHIGTLTEMIDGKDKTDISALISCKF